MDKKILVAEDSSVVHNLIKKIFQQLNYSITSAKDGEEALDYLSKDDYDIVLMDINMPNMDGIEMVKQIKQMPEYKFTPICMLTTESEQSKMDEGKAAGAKAWIVKPFQPPKLLDAVSKLILP